MTRAAVTLLCRSLAQRVTLLLSLSILTTTRGKIPSLPIAQMTEGEEGGVAMAQDRGLHPQAQEASPEHRHWHVTLGRTGV